MFQIFLFISQIAAGRCVVDFLSCFPLGNGENRLFRKGGNVHHIPRRPCSSNNVTVKVSGFFNDEEIAKLQLFGDSTINDVLIGLREVPTTTNFSVLVKDGTQLARETRLSDITQSEYNTNFL